MRGDKAVNKCNKSHLEQPSPSTRKCAKRPWSKQNQSDSIETEVARTTKNINLALHDEKKSREDDEDT